MEKRVALAFFLSLLVILGYNYYFAKPSPLPATNIPGQADLPINQNIPPLAAPSAATKSQPSLAQPISAPAKVVAGAQDIVVETDLVKIVLTTSGARIKSCQLKDYPEEKVNLEMIQKQLAVPGLPQHEQDKLQLLQQHLSQKPAMAEMVSLAATATDNFSPAILRQGDQGLNSIGNIELYQCSTPFLRLSQNQPQGQLEFSFTDSRGRRIKKIYTFSNSNYGIGLDLYFSGWAASDWPASHFLLSYGPDVGWPSDQSGRRGAAYQGPLTYFLTTAQQGWVRKEKYTAKENNLAISREHPGKVVWSGLENKYFLAALITAQPADGVLIEKNQFGEQSVALRVPWQGPGPYNFRLYLGPKQEERLKAMGVSLEKAIDYGTFAPIARWLYQVLAFFARWTGNFGWAIVLLCLLTKVVFLPITQRSLIAMQKMQQQMAALQPEMAALREKFSSNPAKLNKEMMELYRRRGVHPLAGCQSGCLPLLLQMPIFFALYAVLYNSIELRGVPFLGWVRDLSAKDPYYILPILMGVSMFIQQKMTTQAAATAAQQEQAKIMAVMMPILFTWIFASLPSGVVLYWLTFNLVAIWEQLLIRKKTAVVVVR